MATVDANTLTDVNDADFNQLWFTAFKDNNDESKGTYQERYWVNDLYWTADTAGPNFIYFCGEYTCSVPSTRHFPL